MNTQRVLRLAAARRYASTGMGRAIRQRANLSLQEVAEPVGVGVPTISRWETGLRQPRGDAAVRWAQLLGELEAELPAGAA